MVLLETKPQFVFTLPSIAILSILTFSWLTGCSCELPKDNRKGDLVDFN